MMGIGRGCQHNRRESFTSDDVDSGASGEWFAPFLLSKDCFLREQTSSVRTKTLTKENQRNKFTVLPQVTYSLAFSKGVMTRLQRI